MTQESDSVAGATIELLEARLRRLSYLLGGATDWTGVPVLPEKPASHEDSVSRQLARLERELAKLSRNVPAVRDVIQLRMSSSEGCFTPLDRDTSVLRSPIYVNENYANAAFHYVDDQFPDLFQTPTPKDVPEGLSSRSLASIVLSYATAFPETSSRLTSLNDLPIPDAESSAALVELQPQLDRVAAVQAQQAQDISELRVRTARVLQRWYEVGLVGSGECWAEWEGRIEDVEREVRRREVIKERRENEI